MNPIFIIIIYTICIVPYYSVLKELTKFWSEIKETFVFFIKSYKNSKNFKKCLNLILIIFIPILVLFILQYINKYIIKNQRTFQCSGIFFSFHINSINFNRIIFYSMQIIQNLFPSCP